MLSNIDIGKSIILYVGFPIREILLTAVVGRDIISTMADLFL